MRFRLPLFVAAGLFASACASAPDTTVETDTSAESNQTSGPTALTKSRAPEKDISGSTVWKAFDHAWPTAPEMKLINAATGQADAYALSFTCNIDTGAVAGRLQFQPLTNEGQAATYRLKTSEGADLALRGVYELNEAESGTDFVFQSDWEAMRAVSVADRTDFVDPLGVSQLALVSKGYPDNKNTRILASVEGYESEQQKYYYFCNPK